tara:strand:- start:502 stop:1566 length:1065 start_codon:yes stop_codon:yes gene_type:complete
MIFFFTLSLISFCGTYYVLPHSIRKLRENGYVAKDMYKSSRPEITTNLGIILVFTTFITTSLIPVIVRIVSYLDFLAVEVVDLSQTHMAFLLVISIYALYGLVDDLVDVGRVLKLVLPVTFAFPIISVMTVNEIWLPFYGFTSLKGEFFLGTNWSDLFRLTVVPLYVMVVSNLINMHSGYNGLQSGLSFIIIVTLCIKSHLDGILLEILPVAAVVGSLGAFLLFNFYPAKCFEGNIGSLFFGSVIGSIIVIQKYWWFGFFILLPHTFNFFLWLYWLFQMYNYPEKHLDSRNRHTKFGSVDSEGFLKVPSRMTLKWIPSFYFKINERTAVIIMYAITFSFCVLGLLISELYLNVR